MRWDLSGAGGTDDIFAFADGQDELEMCPQEDDIASVVEPVVYKSKSHS